LLAVLDANTDRAGVELRLISLPFKNPACSDPMACVKCGSNAGNGALALTRRDNLPRFLKQMSQERSAAHAGR
ncbi:MAG: hypothetical protein ACRD5Z_03790, partial [Bryobacteraceae bacterium]